MLQVTQVGGRKDQMGVQDPLTHAEQLGRWQGKSWRKGLCVDAPGSGSRERAGEAPETLGDLLSLPRLAFGTSSAVPLPMGCPGLISESLVIGQWGRK